MELARVAECPNCGAPVTFRLASSQALVCEYCRFVLVRSDRELSAIGRIADLVPSNAPIAVGDEGGVGGKRFRVLGRMQLDHGRGPWDEWYLGFADNTWGWLARAQGRWYLTYAQALPESPPPWEELTPGSSLELAGIHFRVSERSGSAVLSAEGELPFRVEPHASGRYVDLEGDDGAFATLDYGDLDARLFLGRELQEGELAIEQSALGPRPQDKVQVQRLRCPHCGAPIPIFVPEETERLGCAACGSLLDHRKGALALLQQLDRPSVEPLIPLGTRGELLGRTRTVIGFMQRSLRVAGDLYTFREYLLWSTQGYSFLVEEDHHWLHVCAVPSSKVRTLGSTAVYAGRSYHAFSHGTPSVDFVIGEFYWKVQAGDTCQARDFIAPPRMLNSEQTGNEINWSEGEYLDKGVLERAFKLARNLPRPSGVAPAQPNPHQPATLVFALLALLWFVLVFAYEWGAHHEVLLDTTLALAANELGAQPNTALVLTPSFTIRNGPTTVAVTVDAPIVNGWVEVESALVPEAGGEPRELTVLVEQYQGYSDGEAWSEGGNRGTGYYGSVPSGRYSMRLVASWKPWPESERRPAFDVHVVVRRGERSAWLSILALLALVLPLSITWVRRLVFEAKRKENEVL